MSFLTRLATPRTLVLLGLGAGFAGIAQAGPMAESESSVLVEEEVVEESAVSGVLSFDYNTHFVSYGNDVWDAGDDLGDDATFNPSLALTWQLTDALSATAGTWWDVNNNASSGIGGNIQEIDLFAGLAYDFGLVTVSGTYQAWIYGSDTEHVFDLGFAFDVFLNPSLIVHHRFDEGASGGDTGTVLVAGIAPDYEAGPVTFTFPANVGYFIQDDFHDATGSDSGFGFTSFGVNASVPLTFIDDKFGAWDLHGGVLYYITDGDVTGDEDTSFLTANAGIGVAF